MVNKLVIIGICLCTTSHCLSQVVYKSQAIGELTKATSSGVGSARNTMPENTIPHSDSNIHPLGEKAVVSKVPPVGVDINFLPLFGNYEKTEEQLVNDELFKSDCDKEFATRKEAAEFFNKMAWQYMGEGDKNTAIYRFNLSYLLDSENYETYWGLGAIQYQLGNFSQAIELMNQGLNHCESQNYVFITDLATIYLKLALNNPNSVVESGKAKTLLQKAIEIQPQYTPAYVQLTIAEILENNLDAAWENFHKAYELNPAELSKEVLIDLLNRKEDPKGVFKKD